jgi:hypothetical protein
MAGSLDAFLKDGTQPAAEPATPAATEPPPAASEAAAAPETPTDPQAAPASPDAPETPSQPDGAATPQPGDTRTVPLDALEGERRQRQDWKERAVKAETEAAALRKDLEAARTAPAPPQQMPNLPPIDPAQDPQGYHARIQSTLLNERLNMSELVARQALGPERVDALITEFQAAAKDDPALYAKLYAQPHPYGWLAEQVERIQLARDPAAYKARLRTEWEAEKAAQATLGVPISPAAGLQPSLAGVRSAAARSQPAFTGPPSLEDVVRRAPRG